MTSVLIESCVSNPGAQEFGRDIPVAEDEAELADEERDV
jgi:hypothetical protein